MPVSWRPGEPIIGFTQLNLTKSPKKSIIPAIFQKGSDPVRSTIYG